MPSGSAPTPIEAESAAAMASEDKSLCILMVAQKSGPPLRIHLSQQVAQTLSGQIDNVVNMMRQAGPNSRRKPRGQRLLPS